MPISISPLMRSVSFCTSPFGCWYGNESHNCTKIVSVLYMLSQVVSCNYSENWDLLRNSSLSFILHLKSSARFVSLPSKYIESGLFSPSYWYCFSLGFCNFLLYFSRFHIGLAFLFFFNLCSILNTGQSFLRHKDYYVLSLLNSPSKASYCFQEKSNSITPHGSFIMIWPWSASLSLSQHEHNELLTSVILDILCHHCFCTHYSLQHPPAFLPNLLLLGWLLYTRYR